MFYWSAIEVSYPNRAALSSGLLIIFMLLYIRSIWPRVQEKFFFSSVLLIFSFSFLAITHTVRLITSLGNDTSRSFLEPNIITESMLLSGIIFSTLAAMGYLSITAEYLQSELKQQAEHDPLTGAYNRRSFFTLASHVLLRCKREKQPLSLLMIDLDYFKTINDQFGHVRGDEILIDFAQVTSRVLRDHDIFARYGGEEFTIILPDSDKEIALIIAERILENCNRITIDDSSSGNVLNCSIGITSRHPLEQSDDLKSLLEESDRALYSAKNSGRNRVIRFS